MVWSGVHIAFELGKDLLVGLYREYCKYVQTAAVRHTDHNFFYIKRSCFINDRFKTGNCIFATFEREPFLPRNLVWRKFSNTTASLSLARIRFFSSWLRIVSDVFLFDLLVQPGPDIIVPDKVIFKAYWPEVNRFQSLDDLAK